MVKLRSVTGSDGATFTAALREALRPGDQKRVADALGYTPSRVNQWVTNPTETPPRPEQVFAMEEVLELPPGTLSRHLGYIPVGTSSVLAAIDEDPTLSPMHRRALAALYLTLSSSAES